MNFWELFIYPLQVYSLLKIYIFKYIFCADMSFSVHLCSNFAAQSHCINFITP